jgi:cytochrome c-type biogenesis protein CcmH
MNFWILAIALLTIPAIIMSWPLIMGSPRERFTAVWIILMIPLAGMLLYQQIGTPEAINLAAVKPQQSNTQPQAHADQQGEMDEMVASLQQRLNENPNDLEGWIILGRTLKTMQRYDEAETALKNANQLSPDDPMVMVELAEASLFASGQAQVNPAARQLIESALAIDPQHQKGLWLMGMTLTQDGDDEQAIVLWQRLLDQLDPASGAAVTVGQQIRVAQERLGQPPTQPAVVEQADAKQAVAQTPATRFEIPVTVSISDELAGKVPDNAVLFVFVHPAGGAGMPLAVTRGPARNFPLSLRFSDDDLLRPEMSLEDFEQLDVSARISMSGIANAASGDFQANLVTVNTKAVSAIALNLDQRVP